MSFLLSRASRGWRALFVSALALTTGVASLEAGVIRHDRSDSSYLNTAAASNYASVGRVAGKTSTSGYTGSGTLIAPGWVLTAAHVVDQAASLTFHLNGKQFSATRWLAHPSWTGNLGAGYDLGLIQFGTDVAKSAGVRPASRYTGTKETGLMGTFVGFGKTGTGLTGATTLDLKKRAGHNMIDGLLSNSGGRVLLADFDNPRLRSDSTLGSYRPLNLEYLIAPGDSGGGLFITQGTSTLLAGVHSFGWGVRDGVTDSDYGDRSGHIRVSSFNSWIDGVLSGSLTTSGTGYTTSGYASGYAAAVPEPASAALLLLAGACAAGTRRRPGGRM